MSENGRDERNEAILPRNGATRRSLQNRVISPTTGKGCKRRACVEQEFLPAMYVSVIVATRVGKRLYNARQKREKKSGRIEMEGRRKENELFKE